MTARETPVSARDLSSVSWSYARLDVSPTWRLRGYSALVVNVSGPYGVGSSGHRDARVLHAALVYGWMLWPADALLIDMTGLDYVWGDDLLAVLEIGSDKMLRSGPLPVAVVCSAVSLPAVRSLAEGIGNDAVPILTSDRNDALSELRKALTPR